MKGRTLIFKQHCGILDEDFKRKNSKGKRSSWAKADAKRASRKIRKSLKNINIYE